MVDIYAGKDGGEDSGKVKWLILSKMRVFFQWQTRYEIRYAIGIGCSIGQPFVEETTILAKTLCHP